MAGGARRLLGRGLGFAAVAAASAAAFAGYLNPELALALWNAVLLCF